MIFQTRKRIPRHQLAMGNDTQVQMRMIETMTETATKEFMDLYSEQVEQQMKHAIIKALYSQHDIQFDDIILSAQVDVNLSINPIIINEVRFKEDPEMLDELNGIISTIRRNNIPYNEVE